jgi:hypothetical protein
MKKKLVSLLALALFATTSPALSGGWFSSWWGPKLSPTAEKVNATLTACEGRDFGKGFNLQGVLKTNDLRTIYHWLKLLTFTSIFTTAEKEYKAAEDRRNYQRQLDLAPIIQNARVEIARLTPQVQFIDPTLPLTLTLNSPFPVTCGQQILDLFTREQPELTTPASLTSPLPSDQILTIKNYLAPLTVAQQAQLTHLLMQETVSYVYLVFKIWKTSVTDPRRIDLVAQLAEASWLSSSNPCTKKIAELNSLASFQRIQASQCYGRLHSHDFNSDDDCPRADAVAKETGRELEETIQRCTLEKIQFKQNFSDNFEMSSNATSALRDSQRGAQLDKALLYLRTFFPGIEA